MASPHAAGAAALYVATHPRATPASVKQALRGAGEPVDVNFLSECAGGVSHTDPSRLHPEPVVRVEAF
jgi:subtilisin family serine protease